MRSPLAQRTDTGAASPAPTHQTPPVIILPDSEAALGEGQEIPDTSALNRDTDLGGHRSPSEAAWTETPPAPAQQTPPPPPQKCSNNCSSSSHSSNHHNNSSRSSQSRNRPPSHQRSPPSCQLGNPPLQARRQRMKWPLGKHLLLLQNSDADPNNYSGPPSPHGLCLPSFLWQLGLSPASHSKRTQLGLGRALKHGL